MVTAQAGNAYEIVCIENDAFKAFHARYVLSILTVIDFEATKYHWPLLFHTGVYVLAGSVEKFNANINNQQQMIKYAPI